VKARARCPAAGCIRVFAAAIVLLLAGCASTPESAPARDADAKQFESDPNGVVLYLYREDGPGTDAESAVFVSGQLVGNSVPGTYFRMVVFPGRTRISMMPPDAGSLEITAQSYDVVFVAMKAVGGRDAPSQTALRRVPPEVGKAEILRCCNRLDTWEHRQPRLVF